jgi:oligopeptide/dipeptide ABC transporter ATP-binding protein
MRVEDIITEPLRVHRIGTQKEWRERAKELISMVGLSPYQLNRYPHQFSGGQRQRIGVARALSLNPNLVICDEPVSALDVSVQAQVLNMLNDIQHEFGLTYLFIAHDLSVVEYISDRVMVMYLGKLMEVAPAERIYQKPTHPYTEALLGSIPKYGERGFTRIILEGTIPDPSDPPSGCVFHTRCKYVKDICREEVPDLMSLDDDADVCAACHRAHELDLRGYTK